jgi:hypothetical protein
MSSLAQTEEVDNAETEGEKVEKWRNKELVEAGYSPVDASKIASRHAGPDAIDLHYALELVELVKKEGLDPQVAADILI